MADHGPVVLQRQCGNSGRDATFWLCQVLRPAAPLLQQGMPQASPGSSALIGAIHGGVGHDCHVRVSIPGGERKL